MVFVETSVFTKLLGEYLSDEDYRALQNHLIVLPESGAIIKGSGGVRKIRWRSGGKGKSGGVRVIYYWATASDQIFMLTLYGKSEKDDLSSADLRVVVRLLAAMDNG